MKVGEAVKLIEGDIVRTKESHRHFKHAVKPGTVTVAGKDSLTLPPVQSHLDASGFEANPG